MTRERHATESEINDLWEHARQEAMEIAAEAMSTSVAALVGGGSGSDGGDVSAPVCWPADWDAREYAEWSDGVNAAARHGIPDDDGPIVCRGCGEVTDDGDEWCAGDHCRMDDYDREPEEAL